MDVKFNALSANTVLVKKENSRPKKSTQVQSRLPDSDELVLSPGWETNTDWAKIADSALQQLSKSYYNISIQTADCSDPDSLFHLVRQQGEGKHLIISNDFMEKMSGSSENYSRLSSFLTNTLFKLSCFDGCPKDSLCGAYVSQEGVTFFAEIAESKEPKPEVPAEEAALKNSSAQMSAGALVTSLADCFIKNPSGFSSTGKKSRNNSARVKPPSYSVANLYKRLAKASSKSQVKLAMTEARHYITSLSLVVRFGEDTEAAKARAAIRSLQKLFPGGKRKLKQLTAEELLEKKERQAAKLKLERKVKQLQALKNKKRSDRYSTDRSLVAEGITADINNARSQSISVSISGGPDISSIPSTSGSTAVSLVYPMVEE